MVEEGKPDADKVEQQNIMLRINIRELQLFNFMLSYYELNCSKLMCITAIPPKTDVNFYCSHSGQNIRDSCTSQSCRGRCVAISAKKNTGRWQMVAQHGGAVQVKALPELWISFSLLRLPGVLYLPSLYFTAIKAAFI